MKEYLPPPEREPQGGPIIPPRLSEMMRSAMSPGSQTQGSCEYHVKRAIEGVTLGIINTTMAGSAFLTQKSFTPDQSYYIALGIGVVSMLAYQTIANLRGSRFRSHE